MKMHSISRRDFLKMTATSAALAAAGPATLLGADSGYGGNKIPVGVQLYSVRNELQRDFEGTLKAVAKAGYKGVEFAGYYNRDAKTIRQLLDDLGLKCCGSHTQFPTLLDDNLPMTIEFNKILGNKFLIAPSLPRKYTATKQGWLDAADALNQIADKSKANGMRVGYHNHTEEFKPIDG